MKIKVISLPEAEERRKLFEERFREFDYYDFFDASRPTKGELDGKPDTISEGELGALLSWCEVMEGLLNSNDYRWLVFEDDAIPTDDFDIRLLYQIPERSFFTQLHRHTSARRFPYNDLLDELRPASYCLVSLMVTRAGAEAFLNYYKKNPYMQPDLIVRDLSVRDGFSFGFKKPMIRHDFSLKSQVKCDPIYSQPEVYFHEGEYFQ